MKSKQSWNARILESSRSALCRIESYFVVCADKTDEDLDKFALMVFRKRQKLAEIEHSLLMQLLTRDFRKRRHDQLEQLQRWEDDINRVTCGKPIVRVENKVDLEEPPVGFRYINECKVITIKIDGKLFVPIIVRGIIRQDRA